MKNQVRRTVVLLAVACVLFWIDMFFGKGQNNTTINIIRGASAGFGLAGCISFLILLFDQFKQSRAK